MSDDITIDYLRDMGIAPDIIRQLLPYARRSLAGEIYWIRDELEDRLEMLTGDRQ
jgi:hypothetical protein